VDTSKSAVVSGPPAFNDRAGGAIRAPSKPSPSACFALKRDPRLLKTPGHALPVSGCGRKLNQSHAPNSDERCNYRTWITDR
jgi:hypothetical protein